MQSAGAILAGGKNSRMAGLDKAFIKMNNVPIIERTINLFKEIFTEIIIVTNNVSAYNAYKKECQLVSDILKDKGPLAGIHAALSCTHKKNIFFVACDMPFLQKTLIEEQIKCFNQVQCDVFIPRLGMRLEPLHAIFQRNVLDKLTDFLNSSNNFSITSFLKTVNTGYWDLGNNSLCKNVFKNVNTQNDLKEFAG